jgi:hypothetical protein
MASFVSNAHHRDDRIRYTVIEIGYSQKARKLQEVAWDYYVTSQGRIKTVLTISLEELYRGRRKTASKNNGTNHKATFCLYCGPDRICHNVVFRSANGRPANGSLRLLMSDLIPDQVLEDINPSARSRVENTAITIPFEHLCQYLEEAELEQDVDDTEKVLLPPTNQLKRPNWECNPDSESGVSGDGTSSSREPVSPSKKRGKAEMTLEVSTST